jgi:hypothetical protein
VGTDVAGEEARGTHILAALGSNCCSDSWKMWSFIELGALVIMCVNGGSGK